MSHKERYTLLIPCFILLACYIQADSNYHIVGKGNVTELSAKFDAYFNCSFDIMDNDYSLAQRYIDSAYLVSIVSGDSLQMVKALRIKGFILQNNGQLEKALEILKNVLLVAERNNYEKEVRYILMNIGSVYNFLANYELALKYSLKSLELRELANASDEMSVAFNNIGMVYYKIKDYKKAIEYFDNSISSSKVSPHHVTLINLALAYSGMGSHNEAEAILDSAHLESKPISADTKVSFNYAKGIIAFGLNEMGKARYYFEESLRLANKLENTRYAAENSLYLSKLSLKTGDVTSAENHLIQAVSIAERENYNELLSACFQHGITISNHVQDTERQVFEYSRYIDLSNKVYSEELLTRMATVQANFEERSNFNTIDNQTKLIELQERSITHRNYLVFFTLIIFFVLILVIAYLRRTSRIKSQMNDRLESIIHARTRALERSYERSRKQQAELNHSLRMVHQIVKSKIATLRGIAYLTKLRDSHTYTISPGSKLMDIANRIEELNIAIDESIGFPDLKI